MGIQLVEEVLDYAPAKLTPQQRYVLVVLAQNANDKTRLCWPGYDGDSVRSERFRRRVRCSRSQYYAALKVLEASGALQTVEHGHNSRQAVYRIPELAPASESGVASSVQDSRTLQPETKGPENQDPTNRVASGFSVSSVQKTRTPTPQISSNKETPQRSGARARRTPTPVRTDTPRRRRYSTTDERVQQGLELVEYFGRIEAGEADSAADASTTNADPTAATKTEIETKAERFIRSLPGLSDAELTNLLLEARTSERDDLADWAYRTALSVHGVTETSATRRQHRLVVTGALTMLAQKSAKQGDWYLLDVWDAVGDEKSGSTASSAVPF